MMTNAFGDEISDIDYWYGETASALAAYALNDALNAARALVYNLEAETGKR